MAAYREVVADHFQGEFQPAALRESAKDLGVLTNVGTCRWLRCSGDARRRASPLHPSVITDARDNAGSFPGARRSPGV